MTRFLFLAAALLAAAPGLAHEYVLGDIRVVKPWSRPLPAVAKNGAAYMTLANEGAAADRLMAVSTPRARMAELHDHTMEGGVMKMRPVDAVALAPGESVTLAPGGLHVMLMGLTEPLVDGGSFPLTLEFERAGTIEVEIRIFEPKAPGGGHTGHGTKKQGG